MISSKIIPPRNNEFNISEDNLIRSKMSVKKSKSMPVITRFLIILYQDGNSLFSVETSICSSNSLLSSPSDWASISTLSRKIDFPKAFPNIANNIDTPEIINHVILQDSEKVSCHSMLIMVITKLMIANSHINPTQLLVRAASNSSSLVNTSS